MGCNSSSVKNEFTSSTQYAFLDILILGGYNADFFQETSDYNSGKIEVSILKYFLWDNLTDEDHIFTPIHSNEQDTDWEDDSKNTKKILFFQIKENYQIRYGVIAITFNKRVLWKIVSLLVITQNKSKLQLRDNYSSSEEYFGDMYKKYGCQKIPITFLND